MSLPILRTKLYPPPLRPTLIARTRLFERLNAGQSLPLTLVSAPAGFGKTTVVSAWFRQDRTGAAAWLSLDESDNELHRFLTYLLAAWQSLDPKRDQRLAGLLQETQLPPTPVILTELINELAELSYPATLILDDYHLITSQAIHEVLIFLIEHLPAHGHLLLISRSDPPFPLARWRGRGQLVEVRADDLRFTVDEATRFFNDTMGLSLTTADLSILETRIEGWIAGLQLAALSMRDRADLHDFIQSFAGSHRYIVSYLTEEVLSGQPQPIQTFLLQTAILDRFTGALCAAVTGMADASSLLAALERANLFLIPLDDQGQWYRYHHLFADVLRGHLKRAFSDEAIATLYERASAWFEEAGLIDEAVQYAVMLPDPRRAGGLVERHAMTAIELSEVMRVRTWLAQLPQTLIETRPLLILIQSWILVLTGNPQAAARMMTSLNESNLTPELRGRAAVIHSFIARFQGDMSESVAQAGRALDLLPAADHTFRSTAFFQLGLASKAQGDFTAAYQQLTEAATGSETGQNFIIVLSALEALSELQLRQGRLSAVLETGRQSLQVTTNQDKYAVPAAGLAPVYMSEIFYERHDLDTARQNAAQGLELLRFSIEQYVLVRGYGVLSQVAWAEGDAEGAVEALRQAEDWFAQMQITGLGGRTLLAAFWARLALWQGDLAAVVRWSEAVSPRGESQLGYLQPFIIARLRLAQGEPAGRREALSSLAHLRQTAVVHNFQDHLIEIDILRSLLYQADGDTEQAIAALEQALTMAEPEGYCRRFIDEGLPMTALLREAQHRRIAPPYVANLLSAFAEQDRAFAQDNHPPQLVETLTPREVEVLHLIADGASNRDIAESLIITVGTVKRHTSNLFGKLGVNSRTQLIARARELDFL